MIYWIFESNRNNFKRFFNKTGSSKNVIQKFFLFSFFFFLFSYSGFSQTDSCSIRISLLTSSPGEELYSTFGHSAFRITDSATNRDVVYNYGTFSFDEPGFYIKFIRGKLLYFLSTEDFSSFKYAYQQERRGMIEQVLNLSCSEKSKIIQLLQHNLRVENKFYQYDFLFDNCTTRLRDLLETVAGASVHYTRVVQPKATFRQLIHEYLNYNDKYWSKLGIDLLLGAQTDAVMTDRQVLFLPDYLLKGFDSSKIGNKPIVASKGKVYEVDQIKLKRSILSSPLFILSLLFVIILFLSFSPNSSVQNFLHRFDGFLFFITGFAGLMILFMWYGTEHVMCRNNYNILWALPTHAAAAFYINSKKKWIKTYIKITAIITIVSLLLWFFLPQQMNPAFIPVILLIIFRSIKLLESRTSQKLL